MPHTVTDLNLHDASARLIETIRDLTGEVIDGKDSVEAASKRSVLGKALALASQHYCELTSLHVCATHSIDPDEEVASFSGLGLVKPNAPDETPDDLGEWLNALAIKRSYGPIQPLNATFHDEWADERYTAQMLGVGQVMRAS